MHQPSDSPTNHCPTSLPRHNNGLSYFINGFHLIKTPGLRRFVVIPLTINLLLFGVAFYWLLNQMQALTAQVEPYIPDFLQWLTALFMPLIGLVILMIFSYIFSATTNWLAAPFNGLLAEKVEAHLTGQTISSGLTDLIKDIPRTLSRELRKLRYYLPRAILFIILLLTLPVIGQILWFLFTAWMMAIQYCDYAHDNHKIGFEQMKSNLAQRRQLSLSFGMTVTVFSMIPIVNLIVIPIAICAATAMYVNELAE